MTDVTTHGTLPADVQLGFRVRIKAAEGGGTLTGKVVEIPAHRRFGVIRFAVDIPTQWGTRTQYTYQECWPIAPGSRRY